MTDMKHLSDLNLSSNDVRSRLATDRRIPHEPEAVDRLDLTPAGVLVPIVERADGLHVMLTKRTSHLKHHPGQISFPGGRVEVDDTDSSAAALRETEEETGIPRAAVELVGRLPDYPTATGFLISPVVGLLHPPLSLVPDRFEVEEIFEVPLGFLVDSRNHHRHSGEFRGVTRHYWAMPWGDYYIWGATAGILRMLSFALAAEGSAYP